MSNTENLVSIQAIKTFQGEEGYKTPQSEPFEVSRQRFADLRANGLVIEASDAEKKAPAPADKANPKPGNKANPKPANKAKGNSNDKAHPQVTDKTDSPPDSKTPADLSAATDPDAASK